jgi:hypothetical protein
MVGGSPDSRLFRVDLQDARLRESGSRKGDGDFQTLETTTHRYDEQSTTLAAGADRRTRQRKERK